MIKKILLGCGLPLLIVCVLGFLGARALLHHDPQPPATESVSRGDVTVQVVETGTIEPLHKVEVKSQEGGQLSHLFVEEGQLVHKGEILATIDPQDLNSQVDALKAQLASAQSRLAAALKAATYQQDSTSSSIAGAEQNLHAAQAHLREAETQNHVQPELTREAIDVAKANLEAAEATLKAQQDALNLMVKSTHPQAIVSAQAAYDQAKAQAENSNKNLQRERQLLAKGFVSQQVVDQSETDTQVAFAHARDVKEHLDKIELANQIEEANLRSQVASATGTVHQMQAALDSARSAVDPQIKEQELYSSRAAVAQAKAQVAAARAARTQDMQRKDEAQAASSDVRQILGQLHQALYHQSQTRLYATMDGIVTKKYMERGEMIESAIASFGSGTAVYQVADLSTMLIKININEVDISKVKVGQLTEVSIDAERGATFVGRVRRVAPAANSDAAPSGSLSSVSGSSSGGQTVIRFPVEIQIDHADRRLKPGMSARCSIIVQRRRNVLRVPSGCITGEGANATVQVVTEVKRKGETIQKVTPHKVQVGLRGDAFVEILSGLKEGEKVKPNAFNGPPRKTIDITVGSD
jgi:HlyD family secretion protein